MRNTVKVDYYYGRCRTQYSTYTSQHRYPLTSETAVLAFLRDRHPGCEITILDISWK